jgi:HK97 family phage major capsid protein
MSFNMNAETSRATGSRFGGVRGYWTGEGSQKTSSYPTFKKVTLSLEKLAVLIYATDEMMDDSPMALSRYLTRAASQEINFLTGDAIVNGDGVGKPLGILNSPCVIAQAKETGQDNDTILGDNIIKMWSRMWGPSRRNAVWLINQEIEPQLMRMGVAITTVDGASTQIGRVLYLPPNGLADSPFGTLMGRPVIPSEWCAELGEQGDIILADLSQYLAITKGGIQSAMSIHLRFDYDETAWRFVYRIDGQPWWPSPLTPYKGSTGFTVGPFVTLAERDS